MTLVLDPVAEATEAATESAPATTTTEPDCLTCDGTGQVCGECGNPREQCACEFGCSTLCDCGDCNGKGMKPAPKEEFAPDQTGAMDLRDDEPVADDGSTEADSDEANRPAEETPATETDIGFAKVSNSAKHVRVLAAEMDRRKSSYKSAKADWEEAVEDHFALIEHLNRPLPLFDGPADEVKPLPPSPEGLAVTQAAPPTNDKWRGLPVDALQEFGATESIVAKLSGKSLETLGDLADHQAKHGEFWAKEIKGLGPQKAAKVADAQAAFWAKHPEYCK